MKKRFRCACHRAVPARRGLPALAAALSLLSGCSSLVLRSEIDEFQNSAIPAERFRTLAVVPADPGGYDAQIAAWARQLLREEGVSVVAPRVFAPEGETALGELCPRGRLADFDGVLFVTWDQITLRDCESYAVAYQARGRYAGLDAMTKRLLRYLRRQPPD